MWILLKGLLSTTGGFLFDTGWGRFAAAAAVLSGMIVAYTMDQRAIGARDAKATIENANGHAADAGSAAAAQSQRMRDVRRRDPLTRD